MKLLLPSHDGIKTNPNKCLFLACVLLCGVQITLITRGSLNHCPGSFLWIGRTGIMFYSWCVSLQSSPVLIPRILLEDALLVKSSEVWVWWCCMTLSWRLVIHISISTVLRRLVKRISLCLSVSVSHLFNKLFYILLDVRWKWHGVCLTCHGVYLVECQTMNS